MPICPNKSSKEWKTLVENLKLYMIELDIYKDEYDTEQHGLIAFFRHGTGEIPNPVQGMRLLLRHDEIKLKRFEDYLSHSSRENNLRWRIKSLPLESQAKIIRHLSILSLAKKRGESKEFLDKLHFYLRLQNLNISKNKISNES
jgi:hypothetical protein